MFATDVDGFTDWEFSSPCSVTCGEGVQEVTRFCQYGIGCQLGDVQTKTVSCQQPKCPCKLSSMISMSTELSSMISMSMITTLLY